MKLTGQPARWFKLALPSLAHLVFRLSLLLTLPVSLLILFEVNALAQPPPCDATGDFPFRVTNDSLIDNGKFDFCIQCSGPFFRASNLVFVQWGDKDCEFYAADRSGFTALGVWICNIWIGDKETSGGICHIDSQLIDSKKFCFGNPDYPLHVDINIVPDESGNKASLDINQQPAPPCPLAVSSFLGDNFKQEKSRPDNDTFNFAGMSGDEINLRVESDTQAGNNGGSAGLNIRGSTLDESTSGTPPLELDVTLPEDGEYSISVEQPRRPKDQRFRGSYILRVTSSTGSIDLIEPSNNVEK
jgi:hypothetical protein